MSTDSCYECHKTIESGDCEEVQMGLLIRLFHKTCAPMGMVKAFYNPSKEEAEEEAEAHADKSIKTRSQDSTEVKEKATEPSSLVPVENPNPTLKKRAHNTPRKEAMENYVEYMLDNSDLTIRFWTKIPDKKHPEPCDEKHVKMDDINAIVRLLLDKLRIYKHVEFEPSSDEDRGQTWQYRDDGAKVWHCKMAGEKSWTKEACGPPDITNVLRKLAGQEPDPNYPPVLNL